MEVRVVKYEILKDTKLFEGIAPKNIDAMLQCLSAVSRTYDKNTFIYETGEKIHLIGTVISGAVVIAKDDLWGNRKIVERVEPGESFGESYACNGEEPLLIHVETVEKSEILFLDVNRVITVCSSACQFHTRLIQNMLTILSQKNLFLMQKMDCVTSRSIRDRVLSYLSYQSARCGSREFDIPFDRQQMAEYLSVDRSALSGELSKMKREGILDFWKNHFRLLNDA